MKGLIEQAEVLRKSIKLKEKEIDNPALTVSLINAIDFFVENVEEK